MLLMLAPPAISAQIGAGTVSGIVEDQGGAAVRGATVTVTAAAINVTRTQVTDDSGGYSVHGLAPAVYQVRVAAPGFRQVVRDGIQVATGETLRVAVRLEVGAVAEAVNVRADAPLLRSETSGLGHVVDTREIVDL